LGQHTRHARWQLPCAHIPCFLLLRRQQRLPQGLLLRRRWEGTNLLRWRLLLHRNSGKLVQTCLHMHCRSCDLLLLLLLWHGSKLS
jgi:hypothetical protein